MNTTMRSIVAEQIKTEDLPLHCPPDRTPLWNMHPKVYLKLDKNNRAQCPYCSAVYQLSDTKEEHK